MNEQQSVWEARYSEVKTGWDRGEPSPALAHWLATEQPPRGRVLVPGCGHGYEVLQLAKAGYQVTAVDIARQPLARLSAELDAAGLHADVIQADLLSWEPPQPFDAIYEQTAICALEPADWATYQERLARWLKPGGLLFALFMQTGREGGPPFDCPVPSMQALFDATSWRWPGAPSARFEHPNGLYEWAYLLTRKGMADECPE